MRIHPFGALAGLSLAVVIALPAIAEAGRDADALPPGQLRVHMYGGEDGLHNLVISSLAEDRTGFLWLGTDDGVYRFDGERFRHFGMEDGLAASLVSFVGTGPNGNVCAGGKNGLVCWNGLRFTRDGTWGVPAIQVDAMVQYDGRSWVGTDGGGLFVQDPSGGFGPAKGWPGRARAAVHALWADARGVVAGDGGVVRTTTGDGVWRDLGDIGLGGEMVDSVLRDTAGDLWIRTARHLWFLADGAGRVVDVSDGLPTSYDSLGAPLAMALGPSGDILVGTDNGVARRERDHWHMLDHTVGLPYGAVRTMLIDRGGTLWLSARGLVEVRGRGLIEHYDSESGMPGNVIWGFRRDRSGMLWAGTSRCLARAIAGDWECLPVTMDRVVRSFVFPPQGGVFVGGAPSDLLYIDPQGHVHSLDPFHRPPEVNILAMEIGPEGDLWIGTKHGLFRLPGAIAGEPVRVDIPGTPADSRFASLAVWGDQLWTGTESGVLVHDHQGWHQFGASAGFLATDIGYVYARRGGRVCAAYREALGLTCFRYANGVVSELEHIGVPQGLTTGRVYLLGEDRANRLWIGTGDGVDVVTPQGMDHFDELDGFAGNDSAATAFLLDDDHSLWFGAAGGATHVLAQYYSGPPHPPRTALLGGELGRNSILAAGTSREVPHDLGTLTAEYAGADISEARRIGYQVRLSPLEPAWVDTSQRAARYPTLVPGKYRFEVRGRVGAGMWGPTTALDFVVLPAWWQTSWFAGLAVVLGLSIVGGVFAARQRTVLSRRMRQMAERSDASFRVVVDVMPDLISVYRDRKLIYLNAANRRFLGVGDGDDHWRNLDLLERIHHDDRAHIVDLFQQVRDARSTGHEVVEVRMRAGDESWRTCEVSGVLVEIGGQPTVVASGRDVTERRRLRSQLLLSDRMASLGTLAAGIAHEINNPLSYVAGNLEVAAEVLADPGASPRDELAAVISDARDGAERVRKIVHGLRAFSRAEEEKREPLALPDVLEAAVRMTANELKHRAQLVRELGPTPRVIADDSRLTQVFINLLVNAAHAIPEGQTDRNRITVRTRSDEQGRAVAEIEDTGRGMPAEVQARVFDPFFTTKEVGEGTGLGLSICHGIITGLGGQISVESAVGKGTIVRVVLPGDAAAALAIAAVPAEPTAPVPSAAGGPQRRRVLLVDDEPQVAQTIERLLRRDYDVTVALCGRDAMEHIRGGARFDAIVSDVMMPNMTGIELVEELRRVAPQQAGRLIFLSGGVFTAQTRERLDQIGAPYLEKPVTARELRGWLTRVTTGAGMQAA